MKKSSKGFLPANLTLRPFDFLRIGTGSWKNYFPFSSANGLWTFSGRVALFCGLQRLKLRPGSTILVPTYFQGCEIETILHAGYKTRFYHVDQNFQANLADIESKFDGEVSAVYVIYYFGVPQPLDEIERFCRQKGIVLIEDCALSLFSKDKETWLGSRGDLSLFSLHKTLPLPHGGYLVTKDKSGGEEPLKCPPLSSTVYQTADLVVQYIKTTPAAVLLNAIRNATRAKRQAFMAQAVTAGKTNLDPNVLGYEVSSVVRYLMRLGEPEQIIKRRMENFLYLHKILLGVVATPLPELPEGACPLFYPIYVKDKESFQKDLAERGVDSVNLWSQDHWACPPESAKEVASWRRHILELPIHQQLSLEDIHRVGETVTELIRHESWQGLEFSMPACSAM